MQVRKCFVAWLPGPTGACSVTGFQSQRDLTGNFTQESIEVQKGERPASGQLVGAAGVWPESRDVGRKEKVSRGCPSPPSAV